MTKNCPAIRFRSGVVALTAVVGLLLASQAAAQGTGVTAGKAMRVLDRSARIDFRAIAVGDKLPSVVIYYGPTDGGTTAEDWANNTGVIEHDANRPRNDYSFTIEGLEPNTTYSYRVCATDANGQRWSDLGQFTTAPPSAPWYKVLLTVLVALAILVGPFVLGGWLANRWRMPEYGWKIGVVVGSLVAGIVITYVMWPPSLGPDLSGGTILVYEIEEPTGEPGAAADKAAAKEDEKKKDEQKKDEQKKGDDRAAAERGFKMDDLVQAILLRVNPGGTREVSVREYGPSQIEVTIPRANEDEVKRIKERIVSAGTLAFRILANTRDHRDLIELARATEGRTVYDREGKEVVGWWVPVRLGNEGEFEREGFLEDSKTIQRVVNVDGKRRLEVFVVADEFNVTGDYLSGCRAAPDELNWCVHFNFNTQGARRFGYLTAQNEPSGGDVKKFYRHLGIVLDGNLYSAPRIQETITGSGRISGSFSHEEAQDLADVLNAGRLPATLQKVPIYEWTTGPTLGLDMIRRSGFAITLSIILVLVFMAVYYRFAGLVACGALLMNIILILAAMILVKADFSLPGLAGLVLTVGMAVDANVIIFERIREELARDAALRMAIRNGFGRALSAIVDGNLTTLITATILWWVGTTQIKGFAVVLWLGVVFSMFTAIFCSRVVFDIAERRRWITKVRMMEMIGKTNFDFVGLMKYGIVFSALLIAIGMAAVVSRGKGLLDIDFTGGESVVILFKNKKEIGDVRKQLSDLRDLTVYSVSLEGEPSGLRYLINTSEKVDTEASENAGLSATEVIERHIQKVFGDELATTAMKVVRVTPISAAGDEGPSTEPSPAEPTPEGSTPKEPTPPEAAAEPSAPADSTPPPSKDSPPGQDAPKQDAPASADQSRADLPPDTWLVSADPAAVLLAQADPAAKSEAKEAEAAAEEDTPTKPEPDKEKAATPEKTKDDAPASPSPTPQEPEPAAEKQPAAEKEPEPAVPGRARNPYAGGVEVELAFEHPLDRESLLKEGTDRLGAAGLSVPVDLAHVQPAPGAEDTWDHWKLKAKLPEDRLRELVLDPLGAELRETPHFPASSSIGSKVAGNMQASALVAIVGSLIATIAYLWIRFQRVMFGLAAVAALVHDVLITLGALAISVYFAPFLWFLLVEEFKISLTVLAAFLTIIRYSLNDTIIVFDRIREVRGKSPFLTPDMINLSINATLSRTLLTFWTTFMVVLVLYIGGGQAIHAFAFAMLVGLVIGTYSSIFIAAPILLWMIPGKR